MECYLHGVIGEQGLDALRTTLEGLAGSPPESVETFTVVMQAAPPEGTENPLRSEVQLVRIQGNW